MPIRIVTAHLPRNPFLRALALVAGIALVTAMAIGAFVVLVCSAAVAGTLALLRHAFGARHRHPEPGVIDGEFTVVNPHREAPLLPPTGTPPGH